jgi:tRNA threonylcarbamoyl adenosine modification protein YeaZ
MKILALEFSSRVRSVAAGDTSAKNPNVRSADSAHADASPFRLISSVLSDAGWEPGDVEAVVMGLGPGSFTGIRTAIAIAQGWGLARGLPCAGVGAMDILAGQLQRSGFVGDALLVLPAQGNEYHAGAFRITENGANPSRAMEWMTREEVVRHGHEGWKLFGPALRETFSDATDLHPSAGALWEGARAWRRFPAETAWEPIHLRPGTFLKATAPHRW